MKVSLSWMKQFTDIKLPVDELVEKIGAQLGAVEEVQNIGEKYQGIVIAKVVSCEKHPDADKLSLCKIDDGGKVAKVDRDSSGYVQVVCGAPNVREGLLVAWLPPGTTVPSSVDTEPFVLEARQLRGQVSNGMLASAHELGISEDHSGIVELDPKDGKPGDDFAEAYKLNDYIIDIENKMFTHRPDCFGQLGVAREIAGISGQAFHSPAIYAKALPVTNDASGLKVVIKNEIPKLVPRFMVQVFEDVKVGPSPFWLQTYLSRVGLRPINNIVDITNYFMVQTGQPMHAYDYDKVQKLSGGQPTIVVRHPQKGEKVALLNGKEITPRAEAIMIATDKQLIGIGGVMGGSQTEVDDNTTRIILEAASFDMFSIRRTSMEHGLFTDAVTRFSKGQSPLQCDRVMAWAQQDIIKLAGAKAGNVYEGKTNLEPASSVKVTASFINDRLGSKLTALEMASLLQNVEFMVRQDGDKLLISPPFWRTDIEISEDIVEEIGRLHGYDKLPAALPMHSMQATQRNAALDFKSHIRQILSSAGANEVLTYTFVHGDLLDKVGQNAEHTYQLTNALSPDLQHYRLSLVPSLLDKLQPNLKSGVPELALFEMNPVHSKLQITKGLPDETQSLALVYAANAKAVHPGGAPYYEARKYLQALCDELGVQVRFKVIEENPNLAIAEPFDYARSALVVDAKGNTFGIVGELKASVRRNLKLPAYSAGFELNLGVLQTLAGAQKTYATLPKFPSVQQDVSLRVAADVAYQDLFEMIGKDLERQKPKNTVAHLTPVDIYQRKEDTDHKQVTLRLTLTAFDRTLKAEAVNKLLDDVAADAHQKFGAERL